MKFHPLLILPLFLCGCVAAKNYEPQLSCIQLTDRNGLSETINSPNRLKTYSNVDFLAPQPYKNILCIYSKNQQGQTISKMISYHANGLVWQFLDINSGRAYGQYREWHPCGILKIEAKVQGGPAALTPAAQQEWIFDGLCRCWDEQGNIISEINYLNGSLHGSSVYYHSSGAIRKTYQFVNNALQGEQKCFAEDGFLLKSSHYKDGCKEGVAIRFWPSKKPMFIELYAKGLLITGQYFNNEGRLVTKISKGEGQKAVFKTDYLHKLISYKEGSADGKVQIFNANEELEHAYCAKNNIKENLEVFYFSKDELSDFDSKREPLPKIELNWNNGFLHGAIQTWYPTGRLESKKNFSNNKQNGLACAWFYNGQIMFIEEYENDRLFKGTYYQLNDNNPVSTIINGNGFAYIYDKSGSLSHKIKYAAGVQADDH